MGTKSLVLFASLFAYINCYAQTLRTDLRPDSVKEDLLNIYQVSQISKVDLLSALNDMGLRIFVAPVQPVFNKKYKLQINVKEYLNGKLIRKKNISPSEDNLYFYYITDKQYADYIKKIKFVTRDVDTASMLKVDIMGNTTGIKLKKQKERPYQFYSWRSYSLTAWELGKEVPLLVFSSSWYDKKYDLERSCGAVDLSENKAATIELLQNSPHYFVVSYQISE
jgi:hypothetical protein